MLVRSSVSRVLSSNFFLAVLRFHIGLSPCPGCQSPPGLFCFLGPGIPININLHLPRASILGGGETSPKFHMGVVAVDDNQVALQENGQALAHAAPAFKEPFGIFS